MAGAIWPPCATLRRTARSKEEGAPRGFAFPFAWPGAWIFAPTKATPNTSTVTAPIAVFAVRARPRARAMRESLAMAGGVCPEPMRGRCVAAEMLM